MCVCVCVFNKYMKDKEKREMLAAWTSRAGKKKIFRKINR